MPRTVKEWAGKTDDTQAPPRVRVRVWERNGGKCHQCKRRIGAGEPWILEHVIALINGGENRESNLALTCSFCLPVKNAEDAAVKKKSASVRAKHLGIRKPKKKIKSRGFGFYESNTRQLYGDVE